MVDTTINQKVMDMVRKELGKNPGVSNDLLFERAIKIDKALEGLTPRQFHARYPLQIKREGKPKHERRPRSKKITAEDRNRIEQIFWDFAREVAEADKAALITVMRNVDKYVNEVIREQQG